MHLLLLLAAAQANPTCESEQAEALPQSFEGCAALQAKLEDIGAYNSPTGFRLDRYEADTSEFFAKYCYRDATAGWERDKRMRDTGPYLASLADGVWSQGQYYGTHTAVVIWYNRKMMDWLRANRGEQSPKSPAAIPDGAVLIKEMYPPPAARCTDVDPMRLQPPPDDGVVFMVHNQALSQDGWYWGAWWSTFAPDWPAQGVGLPAQGFGAYCLNCHASAANNATFADLSNIQGEPGEPISYLSQNFLFQDFLSPAPRSHHQAASAPVDAESPASTTYNLDFLRAYPRTEPVTDDKVAPFPSATYDHTWVPGGVASARSSFLTSDQCIGCHDAGSTGLQYDMTAPDPVAKALQNLSPYGTWRTSPMGLAGRDPIFYAQLASEMALHSAVSPTLQNVCLGCHGVGGQRQLGIDSHASKGACEPMDRADVNALPYPSDPAQNPALSLAPYAALARDGVSCTACHRLDLGAVSAATRAAPQNACVAERQQLLNPGATGLAATFTGSFYTGEADALIGPFADPKTTPMSHALGMKPVEHQSTLSSEMCASCHTIHLPIYSAPTVNQGQTVLGYVYEQATWAEWAMSAFRTGYDADGKALPSGAGAQAQSCQTCHMPSAALGPNGAHDGKPFVTRIASIQEKTSFPETAWTAPASEIDLVARSGFARHTLVGLNRFLIAMADQFPNILGIPSQDPMMVSLGINPIDLTAAAIDQQAASATARINLKLSPQPDRLDARVQITNLAGHKLPSGVGFRRVFVELSVLDAAGRVLWASGRTDKNGAIIDETGKPLPGEYWWKTDCSARLPDAWQPHYQTISRQDQVQIYQELTTAPPAQDKVTCGEKPTPGGALTTSFVSICGRPKDNRLLPAGLLPLKQREALAASFGAKADLAEEVGPAGVGKDPDYVAGGGDTLTYAIPRANLKGTPAAIRARLYSQSIPPFYLQDRFCTASGPDTDRLYYLTGNLKLDDTRAAGWKLELVSTGLVAVGK